MPSDEADRPTFRPNVIPWCCVIGCEKPAEWQIRNPPYRDSDYTEACTGHVGEMLTDAPEFMVYPIPGARKVAD